MKSRLAQNFHKLEWWKFFCLVGFSINNIIFYPGFMSPDTLNQYQQSVSGHYSDWHPPIMAWVWNKVNYIFVAPYGMLLLQTLMLWFGIYLIGNQLKVSSKYYYLIIVVPFTPGIVNISGVIWKDVQLAFALLLAFSLTVKNNGKLNFKILTLLLYALTLRTNAIFFLPPLIYLFLKQYSTINKRFTRIIASVFLSALIAIVSTQAVIEFTNAKKANLAAVSLQDDLAYLSIIENTSLIPTVKLENIKSCVNATPGGSKFFAMDVCLSQLENRDANTPLIYTNNLFSVWFKAISRHPLEYVKYRLYAFDIQIRSPGSKARYYWNDGGIVPNEFGFKPANNSFTNLTYNYVQGTEKHFDFLLKPYFNLWIALLLLPILFKRRKDKRDQVLLYFLLSGISFSSAYFFVAGSDYRYSYWMSCITLFILAISLIEKKINIKFFNLDEKMLYVIWIVAVTLFLWNYGNLFTIDFAKLTN